MYRILLVDDEILVRDAIRENIDWEGMGCQLVGDCENGRQAAEFVKNHPVDIVLTDICMPYMDGMELSRFLYEEYPDVVIVIFSGFGEFEYAKKAIQYNVSEYMLKPVTAMELRAVIEKMKEKVDQKKREKEKLENLTKTSRDYRKNAQVIRSKAIEALVGCTMDVGESLKRLEELDIRLEGPSFRVAVFDMDLYSDICQVDMEKRQESALMAFVLFNVAEELVKEKGAGLAYQEGDNRVCILFSGTKSREFSQCVEEVCREIQEKVQEVIGIEVSVGIGGWVKEPKDLIRSYSQAKEGLQYRYLLGGRLLLNMEELEKRDPSGLQEKTEAMAGAVKAGDREAVEACLSSMEEELKCSLVGKSQVCVCMQMILRAAASCLESIFPEDGEIARERDRRAHEVTEKRTFSQAFLLVREYVLLVLDRIYLAGSSSGKRQAALALDYIRKNYMDPSLSLNSICSYLNISTSYFSTIFKEETGETFIEVLIRTRMEKAKELLLGTTMKNYEIAEKVGFSDPHYFGISFKKMTGKTPTEYARENRR
ncbi:MAG: response regulator [Eubacteriales bacterium]|nr:response regulator [Eubacteriales bacterium]